MGARCNNWFSPDDLRVHHRVDRFTYRFHTIASVTWYTKSSADQTDHLTRELNRQ